MIRILKISWLLLLLMGCSGKQNEIREKLSLAGEWKFRIDSLDQGIENKWYNENGKGDEVTLKTDWTGEIVDRSYFTDKKYERYRQQGNIKIPFWLKPVKYYKGVAWYQKEVDLPTGWNGKHIVLFLERPHWETTVYVNGKKAGTENSLAVAHQFDITDLLISGKNKISIRIDNRVVIPVGINSHSISDHTQSNWNGIVGDISLRATSKVFIREVRIYPDLQGKKAKIIVALSNKSEARFKGEVNIKCEGFNSGQSQKLKNLTVAANTDSNELGVSTNLRYINFQLISRGQKGRSLTPGQKTLECGILRPVGPVSK
jgi:beta-galactosidase/beta-glucuronidase